MRSSILLKPLRFRYALPAIQLAAAILCSACLHATTETIHFERARNDYQVADYKYGYVIEPYQRGQCIYHITPRFLVLKAGDDRAQGNITIDYIASIFDPNGCAFKSSWMKFSVTRLDKSGIHAIFKWHEKGGYSDYDVLEDKNHILHNVWGLPHEADNIGIGDIPPISSR